jgi:hypothetical protein
MTNNSEHGFNENVQSEGAISDGPMFRGESLSPLESQTGDSSVAGVDDPAPDYVPQTERELRAMRGASAKALTLGALDPEALGEEVVDLVLDHVARYVIPLAPSVDLHVLDQRFLADGTRCSDTDLGKTVVQLTSFAQRGELGDWQDESCAEYALQDVCSALYAQAGAPGFGVGELERNTPVTTRIGLVLVAARGRLAIAADGLVSAKAVAVLGGVSEEEVLGDETLPAVADDDPVLVNASDARRWLEARGVLICPVQASSEK